MMPGAGSLIRDLILRPAWRRLKRASWSERARFIAFALGFLFFEMLLYGVFLPMLKFLQQQPEIGGVLTARVMTIFFSFLCVFLALSSLFSLLTRVFLADDVWQFAQTPLNPRTYFRFRAIQAFLSAGAMLVPLWLPFAHALRKVGGHSVLWELWAAIAPLPLVVLVFALAGLVLRAILGLASAQGLRRTLGLLFLVLGLGLVFWLRLQEPEMLADPERAGSAVAYLKTLQAADLWWWPPDWASIAVLRSAEQPGVAGGHWALLAAIAWLAWAGMERAMGARSFELWQAAQESAAQQKGKRSGLAAWAWVWASATRALLVKEALSLWRHPGQRLQAVILAALIGLVAMNLSRLPIQGDASLRSLLYLPVSAFSQWVLVAVAARFAFTAPSLEARQDWLALVSPAGARGQLWARFLFHAVLLLVVSAVMARSVFAAFQPSGLAAALGSLMFLAAPLSAAALAVGLGTAWGHEVDGGPDQVVSSSSGVLAMGLSAVFMVAQCVLAAISIHEAERLSLSQRFTANSLAFVVPALAWALMFGASLTWPFWLARRRQAA